MSEDDQMHDLGKLTGRIDLALPEDTFADFQMLARARKKTPSEFARELLIRYVHGEAEVFRLSVGEGKRTRN